MDHHQFKECYAIAVIFEHITSIDRDTPLGILVRKLQQRIAELGLGEYNQVCVRFNKGSVLHGGDYWHRDAESREERTLTVCYSNVENWSTRIVDASHNKKFPGDGITKSFSEEEIAAIESVAQPAIHGALYDGVIGVHRAPNRKDLEGSVPSFTDWRLFIGFL